MNIEKGMSRFDKFNYIIGIWLERVAVLGVLTMIVCTTIDVIGRKIFNWPLPGETEINSLVQVVAVAGALAITKIDGRHVRIELIDKLRQPALGIIHAVVALIGLVLFILLAWKSFSYAESLRINHEITGTVKIPIYPFALWLFLCCIPVVLILVKDFITSLLETRKR
jgi:TRAP-type C4-dicarboxylate transport system permease small subunit